MIRVLLVTPVELIGNVIASILEDESDIEVVGCFTDAAAALQRAGDCDVVLASPRLPEEGGLELVAAISESFPQVKVLALGLAETRPHVLQYVEAGADGYIARDDSVEDLLHRIRSAHQDKAVVSPEIAAALMSRVTHYAQLFGEVEAGVQQAADLTPREMEVLRLVGDGLTNREIAERLVIEVGTVKNHVHSILQKLDVGSREDAAAFLALMDT